MYNNKLRIIFLPILLALAIVLGMWINSFFNRKPVVLGKQDTFASIQGSKLDLILNMINYSYVDTVDIKKIEESAIPLQIPGYGDSCKGCSGRTFRTGRIKGW